jgi:hypothetical protein
MYRNLPLIIATDTEDLVTILTTGIQIHTYSFFPSKSIVATKLRITLLVLKQQ